MGSPLRGTSSSTLAGLLASARATIHHPTRPETPGEDPRLLLTIDESSRPSSARSESTHILTRSSTPTESLGPNVTLAGKKSATGLSKKTSIRKSRPIETQVQGPDSEVALANRKQTQRSVSVDAARPSTAQLNKLRQDVTAKEKESPQYVGGTVPRIPKKTKDKTASANAPCSLPPKPRQSSRPSSKESGERKEARESPIQRTYKIGGQTSENFERIIHTIKERATSGESIFDDLVTLANCIESPDSLSYSERIDLVETFVHLLDSNLNTKTVLKLCLVLMKISVGDEGFLIVVGDRLFGLSTMKENDVLFYEEKISDILLSILSRPTVSIDTKAIIYFIGILKNISNEEKNQESLIQHGAISILNSIFFKVMKDEDDATISLKDAVKIILQIVATFRNLSLISSHRKLFASLRAVQNLCVSISRYYKYEKLMMGVMRVLAKLTMSSECRLAMSEKALSLISMFKLLQVYPKNTDMVIRIAFTLGSLTAYNDENRLLLAKNEEHIPFVFDLLQFYFEESPEIALSSLGQTTEAVTGALKNDKNEAMIVITRFLANLTMNETIGQVVSTMAYVDILKNILVDRKIQEHEELVLNVVALITNLSYYENVGNRVLQSMEDFSNLLVPMLFFDNEEAVSEAIRVFGNFSRNEKGRVLMRNIRALDAVLILLNHTNPDILRSCCGVLLNIASDVDRRDEFIRAESIEKLVEILESQGTEDYGLVSLICKVLLNLTTDKLSPILTTALLDDLCHLLDDLYLNYNSRTSQEAQDDLDSVVRLVEHTRSTLAQHSSVQIGFEARANSSTSAACDLEPLEYPIEDDIDTEPEEHDEYHEFEDFVSAIVPK